MSKVIETALERFKLADDATNEIRTRALEELKFAINYEDGQWPEYVRTDRVQERRPSLTINQIPSFTRQVTNDARMNRPQVHVLPTSDATVKTAEIIEGMVRQIQASSHADIAYDTAMDFQVKIGFGYFRVLTEYCFEDSFDQDIKIKEIKNPFTVYLDPDATEPDGSDANWGFIVSDIRKKDFKKNYKGKDKSSYDLTSVGDASMGWMNDDYVRVAEYFEVIEEKKKIFLLADGQVITEDQFIDGMQVLRDRETSFRKIKWRKITAFEVLEERDWPGKYIPIIPVYGDVYDVDGKRVLRGMVHDVMDAQRMYNYQSTAFVEAIALAPKAPFVLAAGQEKGFEQFWTQANIKNYPYLPYNPVTISGSLAPPPQRQTAEPPVQALSLAIRQSREDMKMVTGIYDASLGNRSNEVSGKAILARQNEGDTANFHYVDNLSRAIRYLGIILVDLIPKIYDAPRVVRILYADEETEMVLINAQNEKGEIYDVTQGKYDVEVITGPSFSTKRQQAAQSMLEMGKAYPPLMEIAGDLMVKNMDWPGSQEIAERLHKLLPPQLQEEDDNQIPPQLKQKMDQMGQMVESLTQKLNEASDERAIKKFEIESKERIAMINAQVELIKLKVQQEGGANMEVLKAELVQIQGRLDLLRSNQSVDEEIDKQQNANIIPPDSAGISAGMQEG